MPICQSTFVLMKRIASILLLLTHCFSSYAQDCSAVIRDTAIITGMMRSFQNVATLATIDNSTTIYNLWAEKRDNSIFFKAEKVEAKTDLLLVGERPEGRAYMEFIFADTSIRYYITSDWQWTKRCNFAISTPALLQKLATQPLVGLKGYSEQITSGSEQQKGKRSRRSAQKLQFKQEVSFTFNQEEATKMQQAFQCLSGDNTKISAIFR